MCTEGETDAGHPNNYYPLSILCPENHVSDGPGHSNPKHLQMIHHSHQYEDRRKSDGREGMRSSKQPKPKSVEETAFYGLIEKEGKETCLSMNDDDLGMVEFLVILIFLYVLYLLVFL